jgi:RHS repeat-associated protein
VSTALRTYYRGANLVTMRDEVAGQNRYYHFDHQGTLQCLTDSTGAVTDRFGSDAWGVQVKRTGTSINRQWYVGNWGYYRQVDRVLDYVRTRSLSLSSARWISRDPAGFRIGEQNPFGYVRNRPSRWIDPSGLVCAATECCDAIIAALKDPGSGGRHCKGGEWKECPNWDGAEKDCKSSGPGSCPGILDALRGIAATCSRMCDGCSKRRGGYKPDDPWDAMTPCCANPGGNEHSCGTFCCSARDFQHIEPCVLHCLYQHERRHQKQCDRGKPPPKGNPWGGRECDAYHYQAGCLFAAAAAIGCQLTEDILDAMDACDAMYVKCFPQLKGKSHVNALLGAGVLSFASNVVTAKGPRLPAR